LPDSNIIWRIDDRLIHGQVIIGWCSQLPIKKLIVCDDEIAGNDWEKNLLLMAAPPNIISEIHSSKEMIRLIKEWTKDKQLVLVLLKSPFILKKLIEKGIDIDTVNIGGIHYRQERKEYLSYLYLSPEEIIILQKLMKKGIKFICQDLPTSSKINLEKLLNK
jgi:mannose/fructose/N-acetylgalactosamine-specific phosphotransferase system component IIB